MAELQWNVATEKAYQTGVDKVALFVRDAAGDYPLGVAWEGVQSIVESPEGAEANDLYANNLKYTTLMSAEKFNFTIEAYTYPVEFEVCDGSVEAETGVMLSQQTRKSFGLVYRSTVGNDAEGPEASYKYHLIYGARATPSEVTNESVNDSVEPGSFSWECNTTPETAGSYKPTSHVVIDTARATAAFLAWIEEQIWGGESVDPNLPSITEVLSQAATLV